MRFKNLEPQLAEAARQYRHMLEMPDPNSKVEEEQNRQDGARQLIQLLYAHYLPLQSVEQWREEPEAFIEHEDDSYLMLEYEMDAEMTTNLLAFHLVDKLIENFYQTCFPFIQNELLQSYFTGQLRGRLDELQEDALLSIVCMLGKIQKDNKIAREQRLDVCYVLDMLRSPNEKFWHNPLFQRRFMHILIQWVKLIPKANGKFLQYYETVLLNLEASTDPVLVYEQCQCIHEMLKEIEYWLKRAAAGMRSSALEGLGGGGGSGGTLSLRRGTSDIIDFDQHAGFVESEDE